MSREISLFADYHQKENSTTNYCGLLMKMIYESSPRKFEELLTTLVKKDILVGPTFSQQTKQIKSIPDLAITQKSYTIFFETKLTDWFYDDQINRHIEGFNETADEKILFLLSNFEFDNLDERFSKQIIEAKKNKIIIQPLSFEDFIGSLESVCDTEYLMSLLDEFKLYLDRNDLLPKWKYLLDVVNCAGSFSLEEVKDGVYMCPDTGKSYSHRRAKYFGAYSLKKVAEIFEIKAVVSVDKGLSCADIKWKNDGVIDKDNDLVIFAKQAIQKWQRRVDENKSTPLQVFILEKRAETNFLKESSGGMFGSKKYFWDIARDCKNSKELAEKLRDKEWKDYE